MSQSRQLAAISSGKARLEREKRPRQAPSHPDMVAQSQLSLTSDSEPETRPKNRTQAQETESLAGSQVHSSIPHQLSQWKIKETLLLLLLPLPPLLFPYLPLPLLLPLCCHPSLRSLRHLPWKKALNLKPDGTFQCPYKPQVPSIAGNVHKVILVSSDVGNLSNHIKSFHPEVFRKITEASNAGEATDTFFNNLKEAFSDKVKQGTLDSVAKPISSKSRPGKMDKGRRL